MIPTVRIKIAVFMCLIFVQVLTVSGQESQKEKEWTGSLTDGTIITLKDLEIILDNHKQYLSNPEINKDKIANLFNADLREADLSKAKLSKAFLLQADLRGADLRGADLRGADLTGADLSDARLNGANLGGANLGGAELCRAYLGEADLTGADLRWAKVTPEQLEQAANLEGTIMPDGTKHE